MAHVPVAAAILMVLAAGTVHIVEAQSLVPGSLPSLDDFDDRSVVPGADDGSETGEPPTAPAAQLVASNGAGASGTDYRGALEDSMRLLLIQHGVRVGTQEKTRKALEGPFFPDYRQSVRVPRQWGDTDSWATNYILHPGQGAASGFIWLQNARGGQVPFSLTRDYLISRAWATVWALGYSLQFEIGPFSEASIGNVGMRPETAGWVDHVMTPAGGFAIMLVEDMLDRYVIQRVEGRTRSAIVRAMLRMLLTPSRATANVAGMRSPWYRLGRPVGQ